MSIDNLIDAAMRCVICKASMGNCDCWRECRVCGQRYRKGEACDQSALPEHIAEEGALIDCYCNKPHDARLACGLANRNKSPCRCHCHLKKFRHLAPRAPYRLGGYF